MNGYPLECLAAIRARREDSAAGALSHARHDAAFAAAELDSCRRDLADYRAGRPGREERVFSAIEGRRVGLPEIDLVREALSNIGAEGAVKADRVVQAETKLAKCECAVKEAHAVFVDAAKSRMKICEHRAGWVEEAKMEEERFLEAEIEDSVRPHRPDADEAPETCAPPALEVPVLAPPLKGAVSPLEGAARMFAAAAAEVADAVCVSESLARGEGTLAVRLRSDVLDGSTLRLEVRAQTLRVVVEAATPDVRMLVEANRCAFEQYLGERINTWRISVALTERRGYGRK